MQIAGSSVGPNIDNLFFRTLNGDAFFSEPVHGGVLSISSANLFAIGITIDIAIGFIFLIFFHAWGGQAPKHEKSRKIKPMALSMVMTMAKRIALLILRTLLRTGTKKCVAVKCPKKKVSTFPSRDCCWIVFLSATAEPHGHLRRAHVRRPERVWKGGSHPAWRAS